MKAVDDFKHKARENKWVKNAKIQTRQSLCELKKSYFWLCAFRFIVRDFQYNEVEMKADKEEMARLSTDKKKQFVCIWQACARQNLNSLKLEVGWVTWDMLKVNTCKQGTNELRWYRFFCRCHDLQTWPFVTPCGQRGELHNKIFDHICFPLVGVLIFVECPFEANSRSFNVTTKQTDAHVKDVKGIVACLPASPSYALLFCRVHSSDGSKWTSAKLSSPGSTSKPCGSLWNLF